MSYGNNRPGGLGFGFGALPPVLKNILIINGAVFFLTLIMENITISGDRAINVIYEWFALMPLGTNFMPWQVISYQFLHANFSHIFFNMFALFMFGADLEYSWGSKKFLIYYLTCGVGAGLIHMFLNPIFGGVPAPTIGASGAVFGILLAFALTFPDRYIFIYFILPVKAKYLIGFLVIFEVFMIQSANDNIAHLAHFGGALVGFIFIMLDKNIRVGLKDKLGIGTSGYSKFGDGYNSTRKSDSIFTDLTERFGSKKSNIEDVKYKDVSEKDEVTDEEIDRILDKISQSGYTKLTQREKDILFEASVRMNKNDRKYN